MLSQSHTSRTATIPAPESVHPLQKYVADLHSSPQKNFPDIDDEDPEGHGEGHSSSQISSGSENDEEPAFTQLMPNKDFEELFQQFFVVGHKDLLLLRSKILLNRNINSKTLITPSDINAHKIHALRKKLYMLQMDLLTRVKGTQYNILQ